jgi:lysophospholipase L1-like esterase
LTGRDKIKCIIRAHYNGYADGIADIAADPRLGDADDDLNTRYYTDRIHMTPEGYAIVACIIKDAISSSVR